MQDFQKHSQAIKSALASFTSPSLHHIISIVVFRKTSLWNFNRHLKNRKEENKAVEAPWLKM